MSARRNRLAGLGAVVAAAAAALFVGAAAYPSEACAGVTTEPLMGAPIVVNGICGQKEAIWSYTAAPDPGEKPPSKDLTVKNTGTKCSLSVQFLMNRRHRAETETVAPGAAMSKSGRFKWIVVHCKQARPNDPCSAEITFT